MAFLGPLTDMASAILLDPEIVHRNVVVIWIGGVGYGGLASAPRIEFNLSNDIAAANVVFDSGITIWQVPSSVYSMVSVGYAELDEKIGQAGPLGEYLIRQLHEWNATYHPEPIESRSLGDSPAISLMLYPQGGTFRIVPAPRFGGGGPLPARIGTPDPGLRVGRRPVPARGHVRQDPHVRPRDLGETDMTDLPIFGAGIWHFATYKDRYATEGYGRRSACWSRSTRPAPSATCRWST